MEKTENKQRILETLIYLLIWIVIFSTPLLRYSTHGITEWNIILKEWQSVVPFFVLFCITNFLLLPLFLYKKKYWLFALFTVFLFTFFFFYNPTPVFKPVEEAEPRLIRKDMPEFFYGPMPPEKRGEINILRMPGRMDPRINNLLIAILIIGFNVAIKLLFKSINDDRKLQSLEKQNLRNELDYLKHQINPHFFMNTLNNIYTLIDIDVPKAKGTVVELSKMMRYVLYESNRPLVQLPKIIGFLEHYIELMRLRYTDQLEIKLDLPDTADREHISIPPLLLIPFVENAFKHGVSYQEASFIHVYLVINEKEKKLFFTVNNSNFAISTDLEPQGIGLDNVKKRLRLLFGDHYRLETQETDKIYHVSLSIPYSI